MAQENIREIDRVDEEAGAPPLPDAETDDLGASMIDDEAQEADSEVEDRLEAEDERFQEQMEDEADDSAEDEGESETG